MSVMGEGLGSVPEQDPNLTIDVLLPFYGDVALLYEAVQSVVAQSDPAWRLIVVDDGYPDPSVAEWFGGLDDPRISYHRNERQLGANANYSKAQCLATAELVTFMGADDRMLPDYVRWAKAAFGSFPREIAIYQPGVRVIDSDGVVVKPLGDRIKQRLAPRAETPTRQGGSVLAASLLRGNWTYFPSICWRREFLVDTAFRPEFHIVQDLALILDLVAKGYEMVIDPEVTFEYRRHSNSDSAVKTLTGQRFAEERALFALSATRFTAMGWESAARAARRHATSRLNALTMVPTAIRNRRPGAVPALLGHAFTS